MRKAILLSVLFALPALANAFNGKAKVGGIWYNIVTKAEKAEVTADYPIQHYQGRVVIPKTIVYEGVTCNVTAIGEGAFAQSEVQQVVIPTSVTSIGSRAFIYCGKLNSVTIPESVETIGSYAFSGCYNLKNIKLPQHLKSIEEGIFKGCNQLQAMIIPEKVTSIGQYAFNGCRKMTTVSLNEKLDSICSDAFSGCGLLSVVIPNTVRFIESEAFKECPSLKTLTIGSGVEKISHGAFEKCGDLKDVYLNGDRLPNLVNSTNPFRGSEVEYATLYVAEPLIELCRHVEPWKGFGKIVANPNAVTTTVNNEEERDDTIYKPQDCNGEFPSFYGGPRKCEEWIAANLQYPTEAKEKGVSGNVFLWFVVEPDGAISNVEVESSPNPLLSTEAIRLISSMPKWKAGKVNGKYARVREYTVVRFELSAQEIEVEKKNSEAGDPIHDTADEMPSFIGGNANIQVWIKEHIQITDEIKELGVGRIMVKFVVEKDGTITNAEMMRPMHPAIDKEATRVIESMPKWNPGMISGQPVRVRYILPVNFK